MSVQDVSKVAVIPMQTVHSQEVKPVVLLPVKESRPPDLNEVRTAVGKINQDLHKNDVSLDFSVDDKTSIPVVKVTNTATGDIVMQFPSKVVLAISEAIANKQAGALVKDQA